MIGFSKVCQFKIDRERFRHLMCFSNIQTTDDSLRAFDQTSLVLNVVCWLRVQLSMLNQQHAQLLDRGKQFVANLFLEYVTKQTAKRTHIAAQGSFLHIAFLTGEFREPCCLIVYIPEPRHTCMHTTRCEDCHVFGALSSVSFFSAVLCVLRDLCVETAVNAENE